METGIVSSPSVSRKVMGRRRWGRTQGMGRPCGHPTSWSQTWVLTYYGSSVVQQGSARLKPSSTDPRTLSAFQISSLVTYSTWAKDFPIQARVMLKRQGMEWDAETSRGDFSSFQPTTRLLFPVTDQSRTSYPHPSL